MKNAIRVDKKTIKQLLKDFKLVIPPFQRKLVWNKNKKEDLIDSIVSGFPIGAFTLYYDNKKNYYLLVDGLQRYNTINSFLENPYSINSFNIYYKQIEKELEKFTSKHDIKIAKLKKSIRYWYENLETVNYNESNIYKYEDFNHLRDSLALSQLDVIYNDFEKFQTIRTILLSKIDIVDQELAVIIYTGEVDDLPDLFTKINQKTVSLTPYEILHSLWFNYEITEGETYNKYFPLFKEFINNNKEYVNNEEDYNFNLYMNFVAVGYSVFKNDNDFFNNNSNKSFLKNELIFDIFSTIFTYTTNKINEAVKHVICIDGAVDDNFLFKINLAIEDTCEILNQFLVDKRLFDIYSKYYYIYLFYIVFKEKYELDLEKNQITEKTYKVDDFLSVKKINHISDNGWFKGDNRQLSFFINKLREII